MKDHYEDLFVYNHEMNQEVIQGLKSLEETPFRTEKLLGHLLLAHKVWIQRITGKEKTVHPWDELSLSRFEGLNDENLKGTQWLLNHQDLEKMIIYRNLQKVKFTNSIRDILFHVLNHSAYHRGQIALLFRAENIDPPITDYIVYKRHALKDQ